MTELSVTRYIAAKPDKVWSIMVDRTEEWWCPKPWRAEIDAQDRRPLGVCNMTFYGPDGEVSPQNGVYLAYDEGKRFVTSSYCLNSGVSERKSWLSESSTLMRSAPNAAKTERIATTMAVMIGKRSAIRPIRSTPKAS